jgi:hypothetical protein
MAESILEEHEEEEVEEETIQDNFKKVFINHVDLYHGKNIARVSRFD